MATVQSTTRRPAADIDESPRRRIAVMGEAVSGAAGTVTTAAGDAVARLPVVAAATQSALANANRRINAGSDEMLIVGSALSFGFAMGLLFGGANRVLVAGALLPAATMGLTLFDRANQGWLQRAGRPGTLAKP
ncbi:MAG: hypothetical protein QOJ75_2186 [Chloroflexota bacterium]|jgi:hypothetical protein|nr:hypothetical protein [Chloroflexota bacterium]